MFARASMCLPWCAESWVDLRILALVIKSFEGLFAQIAILHSSNEELESSGRIQAGLVAHTTQDSLPCVAQQARSCCDKEPASARAQHLGSATCACQVLIC